MKMLYSINSLALLLERDRGTITRALHSVTPDGKERGQPRWKIATAITALEGRTVRASTGRALSDDAPAIDRFAIDHPTLREMRVDYDRQVKQISAERSGARRREAALQLAPLLEDYQRAFVEIGLQHASPPDQEAIRCQGDVIFSEMMGEVMEAAQWSDRGDFWTAMLDAMPSAKEEA